MTTFISFLNAIANILDSLGFISALLGVLLGWYLTNKSKKDDKSMSDQEKKNRIVHFFLTSIGSLINIDAGFTINSQLEKTILELVPADSLSEEHLNNAVQKARDNIVKTHLDAAKDHVGRMKSDYDLAIKDLSSIDPINSYKLSGLYESMNIIINLIDGNVASVDEFDIKFQTKSINVFNKNLIDLLRNIIPNDLEVQTLLTQFENGIAKAGYTEEILKGLREVLSILPTEKDSE